MSGTFKRLVNAGGIQASMTFITPGGRKLSDHLKNPQTVKTIREGNWDMVVLQEQSQVPAYENHRPAFYSSARGLDKIIKASGARTV